MSLSLKGVGNDLTCESVVEVTFLKNSQAVMVKSCLEIDEELQPHRLAKTFSVDGNVLTVLVIACYRIEHLILLSCRTFKGSDLKILRVGISSFFDMVLVSVKTLLEFDES